MVAIYARQSIDKKDSISIQTQLEYGKNICKTEGLMYKEYYDKGFSGSNLNRPKFKELIFDIENGIINKVICYRLDRISRSLVDFSNLLVFFEKYNVEFISATEQFDTSTPIGRAMINIIMVFAQLERETIQQRVRDNYYARAKKGLFTGGNIAFGYKNETIKMDGKKSPVFKQENEEIKIVKYIFKEYLKNRTIHSIAKDLTNLYSKLYTDKFVKRVLTNTIYVKCDTKIYTYYKEKGYIMYNDLNDFNGKCGAVIYGKEKGKKNRIRTEIDEQLFVLVKNIPVIESKNFIIVQEKINSNKKEITAKKRGKYSWLTGLVKCKLCNSSVGVKVTRGYKYMICSKHRLYNACDNKRNYKLEEIEDIIYKEVVDYIKDVDVNNLIQDDEKNAYKSKENELLIKKTQYQEKLNNLISIASNNKEIEDILKENIIKLGESIQKIEENIENIKMDALNREIDVDMYIKAIDIITNRFSELDLYEKNRLVKIFVKCIYLNEKEIEILFYI